MQRPERRLLRLAQKIHQANAPGDQPARLRLPAAGWETCSRLARRMEQAHRRGWSAAERQLAQDLRQALEALHSELAACRQTLDLHEPETSFASPWEIYADLLALRHEFSNLEYDFPEKTLTAVTERIAFDDVSLGRFAIELHWEHLPPKRWSCYGVLAREPNPAGSDASVTHPHVQSEGLCEGEAAPAIRKALAEGRLLDFFVVVRSVLETYNSASPYVPIEDWEGVRCEDCDVRVAPAETSSCSNCGLRVCDDCHRCCPACNDGCCYECRGDCGVCDETYCLKCLEPCAACGGQTCPSCLQPDQKCENCHAKEENENHEPGPAVHPDRLGQAPLSA